MRTTLTSLFVIITFVANAQFSLQPQVGLENSKTNVKINNLQSFAPLGIQFAPRLALKMDYKFKHTHGPFIAVATSSPVVAVNFTDPQNASNNFYTTKQNLQLRFEGGYQLATKPIYFSKPTTVIVTRTMYGYNYSGNRCGSSSEKVSSDHPGCTHSCQRSCTRTTVKSTTFRKQNLGWFMKIVPTAGIALIPTIKDQVQIKEGAGMNSQTNYQYKAGAWNTAFTTGAGFEFGNNKRSKFVININYLKGIGNMGTRTVENVSNAKSVTTSFKSSASSWNINVGIPISFNKQSSTPVSPCMKSYYQGKCGQYHSSQQ